jgi:maltooligosyltrehalose trehalohydrolase
MILKVWATLPTTVAVRTRDGDRLLRRDGDIWWDDRDLASGTDYAIVIDGGDAVPDPRSLWQPEGVNKASRVFDPAAFEWTDKRWAGRELAGGIVYELHLGTFTREGTLDSAIFRLDYLAELGVDFVELLPVNAFDGTDNWGYDGVLWYAVH